MSQEITNPLPRGTILHGKTYSYEIEKPLGQGTFGITYVANAKVTVQGSLGSIDSNMKVAIKEFFMHSINGRTDSNLTVLTQYDVFAEYKEKFVNEAKHLSDLSKLQHKNIIRVLELFEANNTIYYVMEYIEGGSLDDYIQQEGHLDESTVVNYTKQIAEALTCMHRNNMVHFDLKPANIMRRTNGTLILIDFGLSKVFDSNGNPETSTQITGGTPGYAPMEQTSYKRGDGLPVTMDVYALGATMYKMLTGKNPPDASAIFNDGFSYSSLQSINISMRIIDIIAKAMSPKRKDRYQSVLELEMALDDNSKSNSNQSADSSYVEYVSTTEQIQNRKNDNQEFIDWEVYEDTLPKKDASEKKYRVISQKEQFINLTEKLYLVNVFFFLPLQLIPVVFLFVWFRHSDMFYIFKLLLLSVGFIASFIPVGIIGGDWNQCDTLTNRIINIFLFLGILCLYIIVAVHIVDIYEAFDRLYKLGSF